MNNAGFGSSGISSEDVGDGLWLWMNVNVNGVFWCSRAFGRHMARFAEGSFEAGSVELRVTGAINKTEKIDERAQYHFAQKSQAYPLVLNSKN
ncbi:hypothetical protein [Mesorhizobium sp. LjNodule214]|uniref:hypothetical protein n=1 Tax=Mesorhizobium sp. LjNodule214 TaxID=3342252 RepID=UPI003F5008C0